MPEFAGWRPVKDTHAIQFAGAHVVFRQGIGDVVWRKVEHDLGEEANRLGLNERQSVLPNLPPPIQALFAGQSMPDQGVGHARRERPEQIAEQIRATRERLDYEQLEYTRWAPFKARASALMSGPVNRYAEISDLAAIGLRYVDVFETLNTVPDLHIDAVIASDSGAVARGAFHQGTPWHTHSGWFEYPDSVTRRLLNINIDILDQIREGGRATVIQITTQIADQFGQEGSERIADGIVSWEFVAGRLQDIHVTLKGMLRGCLTAEAIQAISLT